MPRLVVANMKRVKETDRITLRLPSELIQFLNAEAGRHGITLTEYCKNLMARGLNEVEIGETTERIIAEIRNSKTDGSDTTNNATLKPQLEALFEIRLILREIAIQRDQMIVTRAKQSAIEEVSKLLGE